MQHEMPPRSHRRTGTRLFRLARPNGLTQGEHGAGQIEVHRFLGQHGQAVKDVCGRGMPSRFRQFVVNHVRGDLCRSGLTGA